MPRPNIPYKTLTNEQISYFREHEFPLCEHKIEFEPAMVNHFTQRGDLSTLQIAYLFVRAVKDAARDLVINTWQHDAFVNDPEFKIIITSPGKIHNRVIAYIQKYDCIYISYLTHMSKSAITEALVQVVLQRDILRANMAIGCQLKSDITLCNTPFYDSESDDIDLMPFIKLEVAVEQSYSILEELSSLHQRSLLKQLTPEEETKYRHYCQALVHFKPREYSAVLGKQEFAEIKPYLSKVQSSKIKYILPSKHHKESGIADTRYYYTIDSREDKVAIDYSYGRRSNLDMQEKMSTFLAEWRELKTITDNKSNEGMGATIVSYRIAAYNSEIKQTFFSSVCRFYNDFFDTEEFCATPPEPIAYSIQKPATSMQLLKSTVGGLLASGMGLFQIAKNTDELASKNQTVADMPVTYDPLVLIMMLVMSGAVSLFLVHCLMSCCKATNKRDENIEPSKKSLPKPQEHRTFQKIERESISHPSETQQLIDLRSRINQLALQLKTIDGSISSLQSEFNEIKDTAQVYSMKFKTYKNKATKLNMADELEKLIDERQEQLNIIQERDIETATMMVELCEASNSKQTYFKQVISSVCDDPTVIAEMNQALDHFDLNELTSLTHRANQHKEGLVKILKPLPKSIQKIDEGIEHAKKITKLAQGKLPETQKHLPNAESNKIKRNQREGLQAKTFPDKKQALTPYSRHDDLAIQTPAPLHAYLKKEIQDNIDLLTKIVNDDSQTMIKPEYAKQYLLMRLMHALALNQNNKREKNRYAKPALDVRNFIMHNPAYLDENPEVVNQFMEVVKIALQTPEKIYSLDFTKTTLCQLADSEEFFPIRQQNELLKQLLNYATELTNYNNQRLEHNVNHTWPHCEVLHAEIKWLIIKIGQTLRDLSPRAEKPNLIYKTIFKELFKSQPDIWRRPHATRACSISLFEDCRNKSGHEFKDNDFLMDERALNLAGYEPIKLSEIDLILEHASTFIQAIQPAVSESSTTSVDDNRRKIVFRR